MDRQNYLNSDDEEDDEMLLLLGRMMREEEARPHILDPKKAGKEIYVLRLLRELFRGEEAEITFDIAEVAASMGTVSVKAYGLKCADTDALAEIIELTDNFSVYAKTDGSVQLDFTFYNVTLPIK